MSTLEINRTLGHFRIDAPLGQGGMGEVYRATDLKLGRTVALKILPQNIERDPEARARFLQEARFASVLNHPNVVTIYAVDEADSIDYIAMEYVEGETLRAKAKRGPFAPEELIEIGIQCAEALGAAHALGLIHRDIKSANVVLTPKGQAKILDFGLAKRVPEAGGVGEMTTQVDLTSAGIVMGSPGYMSPEQARGDQLDARTDIFSLGCTLYEAATGRVPFEGPSAIAVMHATWTQEPTPPSRVRPELPVEIDAILARCMAKDREERYGSARELADALAVLREGESRTGTFTLPRVALTRAPNNLPAALTTFIGRRREVAEIKRLLAQARLVTLSGPGGCGKTRLAIQVATDLLTANPDGAWLVDLAPLKDPALVAQSLAVAIGVREESGRPIVETVAQAIGQKGMLLLLDNCEHLVAACASVGSALLRNCPNLHVIATSQEPLGVPGEIIWRIPMLGVPDLASAGARTREAIGRYESVRLFVDRAGSVQPAFQLTDSNALVIAHICRRVDGIPLAIELAAARVKVLSPDQILVRLEDRFKLLTGGSRTALPKQQTLRAAVDWSYDLLSTEERTLLNRLSTFAGGFTLEAAEAVCGETVTGSLDVLDLLSHLVDRSLVVPEESPDGQVRYRLLETIRDYGQEKLLASGERPALHERHAAYFLELAEMAEPELTGPNQAAWLNRLALEHDNLRLAIAHLGDEVQDTPRALRLGGALFRFWWVRGNWAEGRARLLGLLSMEQEGPPPPERVKALYAAAVLAIGEGDFDPARQLLDESLALARAHGDKRGIALALYVQGNMAGEQEDYVTAQIQYAEVIPLFRELNDLAGLSGAVHNLGVAAEGEGDYSKARALYEEGLELNRKIGNRAKEASSLNGLGGVALYQEDIEAARDSHERALAIQRQLSDSRGTAFSLRALGEIAVRQNDFAEAQSLLAEALETYRQLGDRTGTASAMEGAAVLAAARGHADRALKLFGAASAIREEINAPGSAADLARLERYLVHSREALGERARESLAAGRKLSLEGAVALALGEG